MTTYRIMKRRSHKNKNKSKPEHVIRIDDEDDGFLYVSGSTYHHRAYFRAMRGVFLAEEQCWRVPNTQENLQAIHNAVLTRERAKTQNRSRAGKRVQEIKRQGRDPVCIKQREHHFNIHVRQGHRMYYANKPHFQCPRCNNYIHSRYTDGDVDSCYFCGKTYDD